MYHPSLSQALTAAMSRLRIDLEQWAPAMAGPLLAWIEALAGTARPEAYFKHPVAFPSLLLPWWLDESIRPEPDLAFQTDLVYSTINGYYFIRLIDNLMDRQATVELDLLPAAGFFHTQFQLVYHAYFEYDHPFWHDFRRYWFESAEAAMRDAQLVELDEAQFRQVAARKVCAGKIPLAAVCCRAERLDLIEPWFHFFDRLGAWHQLFNDLFDWHTDLAGRHQTYFLSEANRRKQAGEPVAAWVIREGFEWGVETLQTWLAELKDLAASLDNPNLVAYLNRREAMLLKQNADVAEGLRHLNKILRFL
jgi:hypothetical protein